MSIENQTVKEKEAQIISDLQNETGQQVPPLAIAWDRIWAIVIAALQVIFDKAIKKAFRNVLLSKTTDDDVLNEFSSWTDSPRGQPTQARISVAATGVPGATIIGGPSQNIYVTEDGQKLYFEETFTFPTSGENSVTMLAMIPGPQANISSGFVYAVAQNPNLNDTLEITGLQTPGVDIEDREDWRTEMMRVAQRPVLSDNYSYYYSVARQVPGRQIIAGYPYVERPGQMSLFIRTTSDYGEATQDQIDDTVKWFDGTTDGTVRLQAGQEGNIPDSATEKRFNVFSVAVVKFRIRVFNLQPLNDTNKQKIADDLGLFLKSRSPYIKGVSTDDFSIINISNLSTRIQNKIDIAGMTSFSAVKLSIDGSTFFSISEYALGKGQISYVNTDLTAGKIEFL